MKILENHNLRVRVYANVNIGHKHYKHALELTFCRDEQFQFRCFAVPHEGKTVFRMGTGHIRLTIKAFLKKEFDTDDVPFETLLDYFSDIKPIRDKVFNRY